MQSSRHVGRVLSTAEAWHVKVFFDSPNDRCTFVYFHSSNLCYGFNSQREIHSWSHPLDLVLVYVNLWITITHDIHGRGLIAEVRTNHIGGKTVSFYYICHGKQKGVLISEGNKNI